MNSFSTLFKGVMVMVPS